MTHMHRAKIVVAVAAALFLGSSAAQHIPQPGASFLKVFAGLCMRRVGDLEGLRNELKSKGLPQLQQLAARAFLDGHPGDVWPIPESGVMGNLVLALPSDHFGCSVLARRGPIAQAESGFAQLVANAPLPFVSELKTDEHSSTSTSGEIHTVGYLWRAEANPRALAFFLTTAASHDASVQLKASVMRVSAP